MWRKPPAKAVQRRTDPQGRPTYMTPSSDPAFRAFLATTLANAHANRVAFRVLAADLCKKHGLTMTCSVLESAPQKFRA